MAFAPKLTSFQKEEVLLHYEMGRPLKDIARDFGLHEVYVRILARRNGVNWINRRVNWKAYCLEMPDDGIEECEVDLSRTPILRELLNDPRPIMTLQWPRHDARSS